MKKTVLMLLGMMLFLISANAVSAKMMATNPATAEAIKLYKSKNYTQSFYELAKLMQKEPSNVLATYYYAMSAAQLGKRDIALESYEKVITLAPNSILSGYAKKGKRCIETPNRCSEPDRPLNYQEDTEEDKFIKGLFGAGFSEEAREVHEKQKIDSLKRDINRNEDIPAQRFKEYKDFSSYGPSNDEIVAALRTLKAAGLYDITYGNDMNISALVGNNNKRTDYDMLNALFNSKNNAGINSQLIQSLLTTQMTTNF